MKFSRHAKNNTKLYKIAPNDIEKPIEKPDLSDKGNDKQTTIRRFRDKYFGYPLKVVYKIEKEEVIIVTVYPLKRKDWR
ncbi:MAG: DUF4258 domain-containing protein [Deltaproteobacteria bacterium]|nr:DUF4258 domain-containing protein [Deltaproteobacteria bacterium]NIS77089.1 DUF4258 domain-containing protein [Deltaproteobacteria bacterium]